MPFVDPGFHKDLFGVEGKIVLLSFGLLSANKGIENVISALPAILAKHPNVVYFIVGATHPHVMQHDGETYRLSLQWLAQEKGVEGQVIFYNRFVSLEELVEFIGAADIYITPYLNPAQIISGTFAYTLGAGKAVISTPYWYAEEMLAEERGALVPFRDPPALAEQVIDLLDNEAKRHAMRKRAYLFGREMIWPQVARRYMESFHAPAPRRRQFQPLISPSNRSTNGRRTAPAQTRSLAPHDRRYRHVPTCHFHRAQLSRGLYHRRQCPRADGRVSWKNSAMKRRTWRPAISPSSGMPSTQTGRFRNFMDYQRNWLEESGSDDSHGRTLWALGTVLGRSNTPGLQNMAGRLFEQALPVDSQTTSPRAWAFALIGIHEYLQRFAGDRRAPGAGRIGRAVARIVSRNRRRMALV